MLSTELLRSAFKLPKRHKQSDYSFHLENLVGSLGSFLSISRNILTILRRVTTEDRNTCLSAVSCLCQELNVREAN